MVSSDLSREILSSRREADIKWELMTGRESTRTGGVRDEAAKVGTGGPLALGQGVCFLCKWVGTERF